MNKAIKPVALGVIASLFVLQSTSAQAPSPPKPTAEHQRLGYFAGQWKGEGEMKAGDWGPGGKMTSTDKCEWFEGKFAVVCHSEGQCPMGATKMLGIMGYSAEEKVYTYYGVDNMGMMMTSVPKGTLKGDTWTYDAEGIMGGKTMKSRVIIKELSPTSYTFAMEMQGADGKWSRMMDSKFTKVK